MRVEVLVEGVLDDLHEWARAHAEAQGVSFGDVVNRALEAERRRVEGLPRLDPRTKRVGGRGAGVQRKDGEYLISELAEVTGVDPRQLGKLAAKGFITSLRPTANGKVAVYGEVDALIVLITAELVKLGCPWPGVVDFVVPLRNVYPRVRDVYVVAVPGGRAGCGGIDVIAPTVRHSGAVALVSVASLEQRLTEGRRVA